ncbi:ubiquitin-conjugating enzyme E2 T-like [Ischnura elegans]|uniref:ubiquitin-conjugating enzyme E2 T-like n=1 Tax=Ischnura elegans TaxID=197161 RepID=UPI001ED892DB|nr:ubiquitin-conjugating enzyme E2 T-like [Ischnura elegans]
MATGNMQRMSRMKKELDMITKNPQPGISFSVRENCVDTFDASILGLEGTPYESGIFKLEIQLPEKYPFEPPRVQFLTPVYHPNVDESGRICLDLLRMPPAGSWRPTVLLGGLLHSLRLLLAQPNPNDPLVVDIAEEFKFNNTEYMRKAKEWTKKYAMKDDRESHDSPAKRKSEDDSMERNKRLKSL